MKFLCFPPLFFRRHRQTMNPESSDTRRQMKMKVCEPLFPPHRSFHFVSSLSNADSGQLPGYRMCLLTQPSAHDKVFIHFLYIYTFFLMPVLSLTHTLFLSTLFALRFTGSSGSSSKGNSAPNNGLVPRFISRGHTYRAVVGDTLVLPCEVENLGKCAGPVQVAPCWP